MRKFFVAVAVLAAAILLSSTPAKAESFTLSLNGVSQGTFTCALGCFGNDITLDVSGASTNWTVTLTINTLNNTNAGAGIAAVSFVLTGFSSPGGVTLTGAPGGVAGWTTGEGPANANGCQAVSSNSICSFDTSAINSGTGLDASPLGDNGSGGYEYQWVWSITGQTFGGFDSNTHIQALFGDLTSQCGGKNPPPSCFKGTGLISTGPGDRVQTPEPGTIALLGMGLLGLAGLKRRLS